MKISIIEAKENLTKYLEMAQRGVEVTIGVNDVPACKIVGIDQPTTKTSGYREGRQLSQTISIIKIKTFWSCFMDMTIGSSHYEQC